MRYWKKYNEEFYSFEEAYKFWDELFKKNFYPAIKVKDDYREIFLDAKKIPANIEELSIPLWAVKSNKWEILVPDSEKNQKQKKLKIGFLMNLILN